jgi:hypothetical protein
MEQKLVELASKIEQLDMKVFTIKADFEPLKEEL